jgi:hypothetical protein
VRDPDRNRCSRGSFKVTILADACATADESIEQLAFEYAEKVVGGFVERAGA